MFLTNLNESIMGCVFHKNTPAKSVSNFFFQTKKEIFGGLRTLIKVVRANEAGVLGNVFGAMAGVVSPEFFAPVSFSISAAEKILKNRDYAFQSLENLKEMAFTGCAENFNLRLLVAGSAGVVLGTVLMPSVHADCLCPSLGDAIEDLSFENVTIDCSARLFGKNMTIGPNVVIGENVQIHGDDISISNASLKGIRDYSDNDSYHFRGVDIDGNGVVINHALISSVSEGIGRGEIGIRIYGDRNVIVDSQITSGASYNGVTIVGDDTIIKDGSTIGSASTLDGDRNQIIGSSLVCGVDVWGAGNVIEASVFRGAGMVQGDNNVISNSSFGYGGLVRQANVISDSCFGKNFLMGSESVLNHVTAKDNVVVQSKVSLSNVTLGQTSRVTTGTVAAALEIADYEDFNGNGLPPSDEGSFARTFDMGMRGIGSFFQNLMPKF